MGIILMQPRRISAAPPGPNPPVLVGSTFWPLDYIAQVTGAPISNLETYFLPIAALIPHDKLSHIAALANGATEVGAFEPINEYGDDAYFTYMYDITSPNTNRRQVALDLGNIYPGDGILFHGRGIIQLTGRGNYTRYGLKFGYDLVNHPELVLQPDLNALIFDAFCRDHQTFYAAAEPSDWVYCRETVNGGTTGYTKFIGIVNGLLAA